MGIRSKFAKFVSNIRGVYGHARQFLRGRIGQYQPLAPAIELNFDDYVSSSNRSEVSSAVTIDSISTTEGAETFPIET